MIGDMLLEGNLSTIDNPRLQIFRHHLLKVCLVDIQGSLSTMGDTDTAYTAL